MNQELTIAVIGLGSIGMRHAKTLRRLGCPVVAFDPDPTRRAEWERFDGESAISRDAAYAKAAGAIIASPTGHHFADLASAIDAGCDVLVEKPIAHAADGVADLLQRAEAEGRVVAVGYNLRFHAAVCAALDLLKKSCLGKLLWARFIGASYLPHWRPHQDYRTGYAADPVSGGALLDWSHEIDLATHLLGPAEVAAAAGRNTGVLEIGAEDCVDVIMQHENGVQSSLHLDYVTRPAQRRFEICGTGGVMAVDLLTRRLRVDGAECDGRIEQEFSGSFDDDYAEEIEDFLTCMETRHAARCTGRDGLAVLEHALAARVRLGLPALA